MKFLPEDLFRLRWSLAIFLVLAIAGVAMALLAQQLVRHAVQREHQVANQESGLRDRVARARDEAQEIRAKIERYRQLVDGGIIGQEERLEWVEQIAKIKAARRIFDIEYDLTPQRPVAPSLLPGGPSGGGFEFTASSMRLQMQLLHEDDLLGFLADLRQAVHAILVVRDCSVERLPHDQGERGLQPQLKADCDIDWITVREKP